MIQPQLIDLNFQAKEKVIASYILEAKDGLAVIETGPGSVIERAKSGLEELGYSFKDVRHIFLTHIHLDHAGAAGWWAQQGAHVYVHEVGAKHLIDPSKLIASATRIYGDEMEALWGKMYPVPEGHLTALQDNDVVEIDGLRVKALDTPGHAYHHMSYVIDDIAFTGDVGGATVPDYALIDAATPPPEFNLEAWQSSIKRLLALDLRAIYVTHFGEVANVKEHLTGLSSLLNQAAEFIRVRLEAGKSQDVIVNEYRDWYRSRTASQGVPNSVFETLAMSNQPEMSVGGITRYWRKRWETDDR